MYFFELLQQPVYFSRFVIITSFFLPKDDHYLIGASEKSSSHIWMTGALWVTFVMGGRQIGNTFCYHHGFILQRCNKVARKLVSNAIIKPKSLIVRLSYVQKHPVLLILKKILYNTFYHTLWIGIHLNPYSVKYWNVIYTQVIKSIFNGHTFFDTKIL